MNRSEAVALAIRESRTRLGLSQEKLAEAAKLHRNVVGLVERNVSEPSLSTLFAIADALGTPASVLIARAEALARQPVD
jgi:transcriptional regulator with XRE-family HTH domain